MNGVPAIYLDRIVDKKHFRAFIYASNGDKKLIDSWESFETHMQSGVWFATFEETQLLNPKKEEKKSKKNNLNSDKKITYDDTNESLI